MKRIIAPSILAADLSRLGEEVDQVLTAGADWIHVDVMDGQFVPPITFGAGTVAALRKRGKAFLDVHLMIEQPERQVDEFAKAGADLITVHVEACPHLHRVIQQIKSLNVKAGVALNPGTSLSAIEPIIDDVDLLLVMTVNPGWGGQQYIPSSTEKIRSAAALLKARNSTAYLEVDGGITATTLPVAREAGANVFVAGSAIFGTADYGAAIRSLRE